jgi:hypothetical protein
MSRSLLVLAALAIAGGIVYLRLTQHGVSLQQARRETPADCSRAAVAFQRQASGVWLVVTGRVARLLPDSYGRFQHQRFILRCSSGQTILIENDISIGRRVPVHTGDVVVVRGQYIWNAQGGLLHFTHQGGPGEGGWILYRSRLYS